MIRQQHRAFSNILQFWEFGSSPFVKSTIRRAIPNPAIDPPHRLSLARSAFL
jgi:hypothetical protein